MRKPVFLLMCLPLFSCMGQSGVKMPLNMSMRYGLDHDGQESAFNGNMASMEWKTGNEGSRRYSFRYDGMSRLTEARYTETDGGNAGRYSTSYSYDKHGNMESLGRNGLQDGGSYGKVDELYYEYDGNRLCKVSNAVEAPLYKGAMHFADGADEDMEYSYDADGNMTADKNKGISGISYNVLNLPEHISFGSGKYLDIAYSSTGEKLRSLYRLNPPQIHEPGIKSLSSGIPVPGDSIGGQVYPTRPGIKDSLISWVMAYGMHRTDYCGDIIYEDLTPTPSRILFDGGYVTFVNNRPAYHFYLADHQGNVRIVASASGAVEETNHYYPFGALFGESAGGGRQRYKYNGKELDRLLALDWYDYGARWYDPVLARWHAIDPLANETPCVSPYAYCGCDPINRVDPDGKIWETIWDAANLIYDVGAAIHNHIKGDHEVAKGHWGDAAVDLVATAIPVVPAGATKIGRGASSSLKAMERGRVSEKRVLKSIGEAKNTIKKDAKIDGKYIKVIPDAINDTHFIEIKDVKRLSNTRQLRAELQAAKREGKQFKIITGEKTQISNKILDNKKIEIERRRDLGPQ